MSQNVARVVRSSGGLVVSLAAVAAVIWWAARQDKPQLPTAPSALADLIACVGLYAVATVVRGWRWHEILRRQGAGHRTSDAYALITVGYMGNTVLPARGGEVLRTVLLSNRSEATKPEALGSIISERLLDAASLVILFAILTWAGIAGSPLGQRPALIAVVVLVLALLGAWAFLAARKRGKFKALADRIRPLVRPSRPLLSRAGVLLLFVSLVVWMIEGLIFFLVSQALNLDIGYLDGVSLVVLTAVAALIPAAPGYVGTFDAAVIFGLKALGVAGGHAVTFALLVRFVLFVPITLVGLLVFTTRYGGLGRLRKLTGPAAAASGRTAR
jgi:glycosyltransferase 2 family protein